MKSIQDWEALCHAGLQWRGLIQEAHNAVCALGRAADNSDVAIRTWIANDHEVLDDMLWQEYLTCVEYAECRKRDLWQTQMSVAEARAHVRSLDPAGSLGEVGVDNLVKALDMRAQRLALPVWSEVTSPWSERSSAALQEIEDFCLGVNDELGRTAFTIISNIIWSD